MCLVPSCTPLFTHDCVAKHDSNTIIKFADDTIVVGLITDNDETANREEVRDLAVWCQDNNLSLNVSKTNELIVDYRKRRAEHTPIHIDRAVVERVESFKFLGVQTHQDSHGEGTTTVRRLKRFGMGPQILKKFYSCTIDGILTGCIPAWYGNCSASDCKALQRVVHMAQYIMGESFLTFRTYIIGGVRGRLKKSVKDFSHSSHRLFPLLPHGKWYWSAKSRSKCLLNSFYPQAIIHLNL